MSAIVFFQSGVNVVLAFSSEFFNLVEVTRQRKVRDQLKAHVASLEQDESRRPIQMGILVGLIASSNHPCSAIALLWFSLGPTVS
jgi:hypothetical protein